MVRLSRATPFPGLAGCSWPALPAGLSISGFWVGRLLNQRGDSPPVTGEAATPLRVAPSAIAPDRQLLASIIKALDDLCGRPERQPTMAGRIGTVQRAQDGQELWLRHLRRAGPRLRLPALLDLAPGGYRRTACPRSAGNDRGFREAVRGRKRGRPEIATASRPESPHNRAARCDLSAARHDSTGRVR
jgi:hypothetical protein